MSSRKSFFSHIWTFIMMLVCLGLVIATLGVAALRIGNVLPEGVDAFFNVAKEPSYKTQDGQTKEEWQDNESIPIFQSSYVNGESVTTVLSESGDKIIAPGTVMSYDFCICNDGNVAIAYQLNFSFLLEVSGIKWDAGRFPLSVRLQREDGIYVMGDETKWVEVTSDKMANYKGTLGVSSYEHFVLEIQWPFDGNDTVDTVLGNTSSQAPVSLSFEVESYAEMHVNPKAKGGVEVIDGGFNGEYGGMMRTENYFILVAALVASIVYVVILI